MAAEGVEVSADDPLELLPLALSRPQEALNRARALLERRPGPYVASVARHVVGIVLRDAGELGPAIRELRRAQQLARACGSREREADVLATLGLALVLAGRTTAGLAALDSARHQMRGTSAARIRMRRGIALSLLGRHDEALGDLRPAVAVLHSSGDTIWEARALTWRAMVHLALGRTDLADRDVARAEQLFSEAGQDFETAAAGHNRGLVAFRSGDLPAALRHLDEAGRRYELLGMHWPDLALDRCAVLLAAGLPLDALREADAATHRMRHTRGGEALKKAELLLAGAAAALSAADAPTAEQRADAALRLFSAQRRSWHCAHARFILVQARSATAPASPRSLRVAAAVAATLDELASPEATHAYLFAGRVAMDLGRTTEADRHLAVAARSRRRGPALARAGGWLAEALRADAAGDRRRVLLACRRGLDLVDEHRLTLGASELRALATRHGAELAALAQRHVLTSAQPRQLLTWSERWRATALATRPLRPTLEDGCSSDLTALRTVAAQIAERQASGQPTAALDRERRRLERAVRARLLQTPSHGAGDVDRLDVAALLAELGAAQLVQLVAVDGALQALLVGDGRVCRYPAGYMNDATREVEFARAALQRLSYGASGQRGRATWAVLEQTGRRLQQVLLGPVADRLHAAEIVVVPPSSLHAAPWSLLPALRAAAVTVAPSATMWLRARSTPPPPTRKVAMVVGPGLATGSREVAALAGLYDSVSVLSGGTATTARVLAALDGAWLAHLTTHGCFRRDAPLFSSLQLADGPLIIYEFEHLQRAPYRLVLASCESALSAPVGADELLGLTSTLIPLGTVGIVASLVRVNDAATVPLMHALHKRISRGDRLPEALREARAESGDDPVSRATAFSFLALGGG